MSRRERFTVALDFISITLIAIFFLTLLFGGLGGLIGKDQASVNLAQFLIGFEVVGIIGATITKVLTLGDAKIGKQLFSKQLLYIMGSLAGFFLLNIVVPATVPFQFSLATSGKFTAVMISIPEETVMRGWLAPWLANTSRLGILGGAVGSAALFTVYHLFVYGTSLGSLVIVFGAGLIAGFAVLKTGRLSTVMATHLFNNFLAVGGI